MILVNNKIPKQYLLNDIFYLENVCDKFLNNLFLHSDINGLAYDFLDYKLTQDSYTTFWPINKVVDRIYLHDSNAFKPIIICLQNSFGYLLDLNDLIIILHSDFRNKLLSNLKDKQYFDLLMNKFYTTLFEVFESDRDLFFTIFKHLEEMIDNIYVKCNFSLLYTHFLLEKNLDEIIEYFDIIKISNFSFEKTFEKFVFIADLYSHIITLMPFLAVPCADQLIANAFGIKHNLTQIPFIANYCGQSYQIEPMKLKNLCRIVIRKTIFNANKNDSNAVKLDKLKSLQLPSEIIRFLLFQYKNYQIIKEKLMTAHENDPLEQFTHRMLRY